MTLPVVTPERAKALLDDGARLIDIRGADEFARGRIAGARNVPLGEISRMAPGEGVVIFHCRTGMRTRANADALAAAAGGEAYGLDGGIEAWARAGLPVLATRGAPLEIMRQVQIVAGSLILAGVGLSVTVAPGFVGLAGFVGAGLLLAGLSGWCGMAHLLAAMPWNRRA